RRGRRSCYRAIPSRLRLGLGDRSADIVCIDVADELGDQRLGRVGSDFVDMGQGFGLGLANAGFGSGNLGGEIGFDSAALGSEIGLDRLTAFIGDALCLGLGLGKCLLIGGDGGVGLLTRLVGGSQIGFDHGLALLDDAA